MDSFYIHSLFKHSVPASLLEIIKAVVSIKAGNNIVSRMASRFLNL